jgi:hypothetical protein
MIIIAHRSVRKTMHRLPSENSKHGKPARTRAVLLSLRVHPAQS